MSKNRSCFAALAFFVLAATLVKNTNAATYIVGDNLGWLIPPNADAYATWASQNTFTIGDILVFNFPTGQHDVALVTRDAYDACNSSSPTSLLTVGPANVSLDSAGQQFFMCTFGQHCLAGQKLAINVATSLSPSPSPSPTPEITPLPSPIPSSSSVDAPSPSPFPETPSPSSVPSSPGPSPRGSSISPSTPSTIITPSERSVPAGSFPGGDGIVPPPPTTSAGARLGVATVFVAMIISATVGFMF